LGAPKPARDALTAAQACRPTLQYLIYTEKENGAAPMVGFTGGRAEQPRSESVFAFLYERVEVSLGIYRKTQ
jgi:hypothetical protein